MPAMPLGTLARRWDGPSSLLGQPNLAVTGSLAADLWWRAGRTAGSQPSARLATLLGLGLAPLTIAGALGSLAIVRC